MSSTDTRYAGNTDRVSGRHPISVGHFVMGIAFLGIVVVWALIEADAVSGDDIRWLLPVPWVLAGIAGLVATTRRGRHETIAAPAPGWVGDEPVTRGYDRLDELDELDDPTDLDTSTDLDTTTDEAAPNDPATRTTVLPSTAADTPSSTEKTPEKIPEENP